MKIELAGHAVTLALALCIGCGGSQQAVRADQMSAEAHRQQAQKDRAAASEELRRASSSRREQSLIPSAGPQGYDDPAQETYGASTEHAIRARQLSKHAQQHEAAAAALESFEQAECKELPPATRAACPLLGPLVELVDVPGGIRARFREVARVDSAIAQMRCHLAYAQARGFDTATSCPLYVRGIEIRRAAEPGAVEIIGRDAGVVSEIRRRAREEAVLSPPATN